MNVSLDNRKSFQNQLNEFLNVIMYEPELLEGINNSPVDLEYVKHIENLMFRLNYIK